jgi:hypothetical protein
MAAFTSKSRRNAGFTCADEPLRGGDVCVVERAADLLHCARINAKPFGYLAYALCASRLNRGPPQPFALILGPF